MRNSIEDKLAQGEILVRNLQNII